MSRNFPGVATSLLDLVECAVIHLKRCVSRHAKSAGEQYEQDFIPHRLCNWEVPAVKVRLIMSGWG